MRPLGALLLLAVAAPADPADDYFELGLSYLRTAFYRDARAAFAESLVRAPAQPVPTAFLAVACAGENRDSATCATLIRSAYRRLPAKTTLRIDLDRHLRGARDRQRIEDRYRKRLAGARGTARIDTLTVLAFFEVHDGTPESSPALDALLKERPDDAVALALVRLRPKPKAPETGEPGKKAPEEADEES